VRKTTLWRAGIEEARERCFRVLVASPAEAGAAMSSVTSWPASSMRCWPRLPPPQRRALEVALLLAARAELVRRVASRLADGQKPGTSPFPRCTRRRSVVAEMREYLVEVYAQGTARPASARRPLAREAAERLCDEGTAVR
jgi:hypothetical protein